ncbi:unnamed protein product [Linum trigynum]|uniref:KIB1-4 beta-propeller domain-containing protein n=2 Tax=Linum trigynum TaxID=586398 RepID=A0AAV2DUB7_9ROSI
MGRFVCGYLKLHIRKAASEPRSCRLQFRSVCKNWRQISHRHAGKSPASWAPLKPAMSAEIPGKIREELSCACIRYCWPGSGWLLLSISGVGIMGLFNPFLHWPTSFVRLPALPHSVSQPPSKAAFSAPPTDPDWTIFIVRDSCSFSTFRRGELRWSDYTCRGKGNRRYCDGIGYREGSFFCLFDTGDVLIFGVGAGRRMGAMLVAVAAPPAMVMLVRQNRLRVVAAVAGSDGEFLVMSWGRGGGGSGIRLLHVERKTREQLQDGRGWGSDILVKEWASLIVEETSLPPMVADVLDLCPWFLAFYIVLFFLSLHLFFMWGRNY